MRTAQAEQWFAKQQAEELTAFYNDRFRFGEGDEENTEKKEVTFQREKLYEEIWKLSLSKVARKYDVPYQKLRSACKEADIPLPSKAYWGNLSMGNPVQKEPLPESSQTLVTVRFSVRTAPPISQTQLRDYLDKKSTAYEKDNTVISETDETAPPPKTPYGGNVYEREALYDEVWQQLVTKVAKRYGVSDVMIHKVCKELNVPVPPSGYWAKKAAGKPVEQEPLPEYAGKTAVYGIKAGVKSRVGELLLSLYIQSEDARIYRKEQEAARQKAEEEAQQKRTAAAAI